MLGRLRAEQITCWAVHLLSCSHAGLPMVLSRLRAEVFTCWAVYVLSCLRAEPFPC